MTTSQTIDWNAIGSLVNAYHDATGQWLGYDQIVALNWTPTSTTSPGPVTGSANATTIGTGTDRFVIKLSEDAYNGDAQYTVSVDGKQIGGTLTAHASHALGQSDTLTLLGNWGSAAHKVTVSFLNDSYGGSAATDRNLHVDAVSYNGKAQAGGKFDLLANGSHDVAIAATVVSHAPSSTTVGTGADSLVIKLSEDAYNGDAQYTVSVDGKQVGGTLTASALHSSGQSDTLTLHGNWGAGAHTVTVTFLNDLYGGSSATDRNLHVDAISYNGKAQAGGSFDLLSNGSHDFAIASTVTPPISSGVTTSGESILPSGYDLVWRETFDGGLGKFSHNYGHVWAHDGQVDIGSWAGDGFGQSGAMIAPSGSSAGFGYGLFSWTVKGNQDSAPGAFMCLWPASDQWPGPELDMAEVAPDGSVYSTIHWKGADGSDQFQSYKLDGIKFTDKHTYALDWQDGRLTGYVDGVQKWTTTEHVPKDFAHGGENSVPGVGEQAAWAAAYQNGDNLVTLYEATYSTHAVIA
ncbi:family 16 glycosylhydrolase [Belnapia sp. T6]|uniref:Family 16 glycosylhydrolase n=1 Tax=Belnapia mucosa TaxID=2804532 RepID=A0ABS1VB27_9PROT|nr:carbohydrate-binding domain-containing protein [Belnapia mucosa]MBL6458882.1 family 16 glycosylhydrolase [Belnapia mucosa]